MRITVMHMVLLVILAAIAGGTNAFEPCPNRSEFRCHTIDRECISAELLCDAHIDCRDGSDEKDCRKWILVSAQTHVWPPVISASHITIADHFGFLFRFDRRLRRASVLSVQAQQEVHIGQFSVRRTL